MKSWRIKGLIASGVATAALAIGAALPAGAATTVSYGTPTMVAKKVLVDVPINVVCDTGVNTTVILTITIRQTSGKTVNLGSGSVQASSVNCDGSTVQTYSGQILGNMPWKHGAAVIMVTGQFTGLNGFEFVSTPWTSIRL